MSTFINAKTGVKVSVADSKDDRFGGDWESEKQKAPAKKAASKSK